MISQVIITGTVLVLLYMFFALLDYQGGFDLFFGMTFFQPILAVFFSAVTVVCCFLVGLPIRLIDTVHRWWRTHFYLAPILVFVGFTLLVLACMPPLTQQVTVTVEGGRTIERTIPNTTLAISGWFLTGFSTLHTYPPAGLIERAKETLKNTISNGKQDRLE